ncbi:Pre-mRNA-processing protein 40C [Acorus calamus]|uniref:Pre-mRNA-processing protein 40C n=1 Tax=Acorus calamus TaxID=4465 RepID=A0AAV9FL61_ACOCL|nr:Pre-mRNA-processing protein 40C [Acorus calamus]
MSSPSTQSSGGPQTAPTPITCSSSTETFNSPSGALASASPPPSMGGTPTPSVAGPPTPVGPTSPLFYRTPNPAPGSTQQPPSAPVMRFPPPQSPAALQPPVPGQSSSTWPSFSYNVSSSSGQQATTSGHLSGGKLTPPTTATLQSTVSGQPIHPNPSVPGAVAPRLQTPMHPPFSASTVQASTAESFSFNSSSQLPTTTEDLHKHSSSNSVCLEKLAGTDWVLVATNDGKKYYYNSKSKISSWQVPPEVAELRKKQDADSAKANATSAQESNLSSLDAPAVITGGRDAVSLRSSVASMSSSQVELVKKKLHDASTPVTSSPVPASSAPLTSIDLNDPKAVEPTLKGQHSENSKERPKDAGGDGNVSESSSDADDVDSGPKKEDYIFQFKEMLKERGVAPFSKWDKELPKILFDPRFKAVPGYDTRKALFEQFVKTRAEEERKEKRAAQKAALEGFKQLLEEASEEIDHKTDYETFKRKWGSDPRFGALDRKERELLLNERVLPLKKAVEERIQATRAAAVSSFKSMLRDNKNITINSRWSRVKDGLRGDPRYKSVKHEDREEKLKEREREMRKRKEREELEMERIRLKVRRTGAVSSYQSLLVEIIKDPKASWTESKPKLEKDPQGRAMNPDLDPVDMEKLFREHVRSLQERLEKDFCTLLSEVITPEAASQTTEDGKTILTSWSAAKRLLRSDPRYLKLSSKDRESLWNRYADKMQRKMKLESGANAEKPNTEIRHRTSSESARRSPRRNNYGRR